jgi:DNA-binding NarL/FixJ family response regulator
MPDVALLILSSSVQPQFARRLLAERTRGRGYLLKERVTSPDVLCDAIRRLIEGYCHIDPGVANYLAERQRAFAELSEREVEILSLMAQGRSNAGIGRQLSLAERTVETHVRNIMVKLGLEASPYDHRRVLAVVAYLARSG